jgi:hypothetical protein
MGMAPDMGGESGPGSYNWQKARIAALEAALRDMLKLQTLTIGPRTAEIIRKAEEVLREH